MVEEVEVVEGGGGGGGGGALAAAGGGGGGGGWAAAADPVLIAEAPWLSLVSGVVVDDLPSFSADTGSEREREREKKKKKKKWIKQRHEKKKIDQL